MMKKYVWGFKGLMGVSVSVVSRGPNEVGNIEVKGIEARKLAIAFFLSNAYTPWGHRLGKSATPIELYGVLTGYPPYGLANLQPYPAHPHKLGGVSELPDGAIS